MSHISPTSGRDQAVEFSPALRAVELGQYGVRLSQEDWAPVPMQNLSHTRQPTCFTARAFALAHGQAIVYAGELKPTRRLMVEGN